MTKALSNSDVFYEIDLAVIEEFGPKLVDNIMTDLHNTSLSIQQVAERNGISMGYVVQVARFNKVDPNTLEKTA